MASLNKLREDGQWDKVFGHVLRPKRDPRKQTEDEFEETWRLRLRNHLTGRRCLMLEAAAHAHAGGRLRAVTQQLADCPGTDQLGSLLEAAASAYEARRNLIGVLTDGEVDEVQIATAIRQVVEATEHGWQYSPDKSVEPLARGRIPDGESIQSGHAREPSFMDWLPNESWRRIFRTRALQHRWMHPGLLLAGETLAAIVGDHRTRDAVAETWIMFAWNDPGRPQGILARLKMERLPNGCGVLLPDAWSAGYLQMDADFSRGLQRAWLAVQQRFSTPCEFDWRWSLDLQHATRRLPGAPVVVPLTGPSAEAAFACALRAVDGRDKDLPRTGAVLDCHVAVTARLDQDLGRNPRLQPVTDVGIKTLNLRFVERVMQSVVLAKDHDDADLPPTDARLRFEKLATFDEAYHQLTRWPKITRAVKEKVAEEASWTLDRICGKEPGNPRETGYRYVMSPLAERLPIPNNRERVEQPEAKERPLSRKELRAFACGRWMSKHTSRHATADGGARAPRIRLFADSGLGKSTLLVECARRIAERSDQRVPVLLGKVESTSQNLSSVNWDAKCDEIRQNLLSRCVLKHVPDTLRPEAELWFADLMRTGRLVFLFDALDQSQKRLIGMGGFLQAAETERCPAILAGRPETRQSRSEAFEGQTDDDWTTLLVLPFGRDEQQKFLGQKLRPVLIPMRDELSSFVKDPDEIRRHLWKDLLGVPLLLNFLKTLASDAGPGDSAGLLQLSNRYEIYAESVRHLLEKGLSTIDDADQRDHLEVTAPEELQVIAWAAVRQHNFSGIVAGDDYRETLRRLGSNYFGRLVQADLVTKHGILEGVSPRGLEFRHRSFLEYFAGCRLAELFADPATREEKVAVLRGVQSVEPGDPTHPDNFENADGTLRDLPADWHWTLRFALCHAATLGVHNALAAQLMRLGNPWIVYEAIDRDGLSFDPDLAQVCRWLVHRDLTDQRDYRNAWPAEDNAPVAAWGAVCRRRELGMAGTASTAGWLEDLLLNRSTRDGAYLQPLCELLETTIAASDGHAALVDIASACRSALETYLQESAARRLIAPGVLPVYESRFIPLPPGEFDPARFHKEGKLQQAGVTGPVSIPAGLKLSDFPVTNAELEEWCPTHRRWRSEYSHEDDQPAICVSWYMAVEFARWLTGEWTDGTYELPTEWVWEYACRWRSKSEYWWGNAMRDDVCWYGKTGGDDCSTRSREAAIQLHESARLSHPSREWAFAQGLPESPGLLDLLGNVWEWTASKQAYESDRIIRGGSWHSSADHCRSASLFGDERTLRFGGYGLRLCWRSRRVSPESASS